MSCNSGTAGLVLLIISSSLFSVALTPSVFAVPVVCGTTITSDMLLGSDLTGCTADGLIIGANNIILDCNGHTLSGNGVALYSGIKVCKEL